MAGSIKLPEGLTEEAATELRHILQAPQSWVEEPEEFVGVSFDDPEHILVEVARHLPGTIYQFKVSPDGRFSVPYISTAVERIANEPASRVVQDDYNVMDDVVEEDRARISASIMVSARDLSLWQEEFRIDLAEAGVRHMLGVGSPSRLPDGSTLWTSIALDITSQKDAEAKTGAILDAIPDAVLVLDDLGRVEACNQGCTRLFGEAISDLEGKTIAERFEPAPSWRVTHELQRARVVGPGEPREVEISVAPAPRPSVAGPEVRSGMVVVVRDVTDRARAEDEHRRAQRLQVVGQLATGIAHDFNNLLTVVQGYTELAQLEVGAGEVSEDLDEVLAAVRRGRGLTGQLLAFARTKGSEVRTADIGESLSGLGRWLGPVLGDDVQLELTSDPGLFVAIDVSQLEQVFLNLAINARHAMPDGGALRIVGRSRHLEDGAQGGLPAGAYVEIVVSDDGVGMSPEVQARVFDAFFTTKTDGTGLGLATSFGIVAQAGGHMSVDSEAGRGCTFTILLPRSGEDGSDPSGPIRTARDLLRGSRVLFAEDNDVVRRFVARLLEKQGAQVEAVVDGREAARVFEPGRFAVVIADLQMPGLGGADLVKTIRAQAPEQPILITTGFAHQSLDPDVPVLTKPFSTAELLDALTRALAGD